jgi:hypothetical protein
MSLSFQNISIPFAQGLDTKSDPYQVPIGKLSELENAVFTNTGQLNKRYGHQSLSRKIDGSGPIDRTVASAIYKDELLQFDGKKVYSYSDARKNWRVRGNITSVNTELKNIVRNHFEQINPDGAALVISDPNDPSKILNTLECYAWVDTRGGIYHSVIDRTTGAVLADQVLIEANSDVLTCVAPKVVAFHSNFHIFYERFDISGESIVSCSILEATIQPAEPLNPIKTTVASDLWVPAGPVGTWTPYDVFANVNTFVNNIGGSSATWDGFIHVAYPKVTSGILGVKTLKRFNPTWVTQYDGPSPGNSYQGLLGPNPPICTGAVSISRAVYTYPGEVNEIPVIMFVTVDIQYPSDVYLYMNIWSYPDHYNEVASSYSTDYQIRSIGSIGQTPTTSNSQTLKIWVELDDYTSSVHRTTIQELVASCSDYTSWVISPAFFIRGAHLWGKPFKYDDQNFIPVVFTPARVTDGAAPTSYQYSYYLMSENGNVVSKSCYFEGYTDGRVNTQLCESTSLGVPLCEIWEEIIIPGSGGVTEEVQRFETQTHPKFLLPQSRAGNAQTINGTVRNPFGVASSTIDFEHLNTYRSAYLGNNLMIAGGILQMYDGLNVVEHGFLTYPEVIGYAQNIESGGAIAPGTYDYQFCYEWTDNQGQLHKSAPSITTQIIIGAGDTIVFSVSNLCLTQKPAGTVRIVGYRTQAAATNDPTYYRFTDSLNPTISDPTSDVQSITDDGSVFSTDNEFLYTTGKVLPNIAPPSSGLITSYKNRIFLGGGEDPSVLWYSKLVEPGEPVQFSSRLYINVDSRNGPVSSLFPEDDRLLIFTPSTIFILSGEGPTATGGQNDYPDPAILTVDAGCDNQDSITLTPDGVVFQSAKGIYLINRQMQAEYIGAPVERYNDLMVTGAALCASTHQIRFSTIQNCLVYDYYFKQWGIFTPHHSVDCGIWKGKYYYLQPDGTIFVEDPTVYTDANIPYSMKAVTGWLNLAQLQGYKRLADMYILGSYKGPHVLQVAVAYDFNEMFGTPSTIDTATVLGNGIYGNHVPFGTDGVYGGTFSAEQFRMFFSQEQCESIKISILETESATAQGALIPHQALALSAISLTVGVQKGAYKIPSSKHFGV